MCSHFRRIAAFAFCLAFGAGSGAEPVPAPRVLKVCSDPNNMPFSNRAEEGFENRMAQLIASDLQASVEYTWFPQRRGFLSNTLRAGLCDVVMGVPSRFEPVETTRPYYRSTYVFVTQPGQRISSLDDAILHRLRIGVHVIGDDYANPPPAHALGRRGIIRNVSGYSIYGDYSRPNPPARLVEAVATKGVDLAIVWGPFGGYFGTRQGAPLRITPVSPDSDASLPLTYEIAVGVRKGDTVRRDELQRILDRRKIEIKRILDEYGVPLKRLNEQVPAGAAR
ncbi:MAG TPA: substrate-binding domain-containing protein [Bryobacteraceae bacterium]|nr:substrate-binding domain-containing protein [Bryobacteraceae bacterium]